MRISDVLILSDYGICIRYQGKNRMLSVSKVYHMIFALFWVLFFVEKWGKETYYENYPEGAFSQFCY